MCRETRNRGEGAKTDRLIFPYRKITWVAAYRGQVADRLPWGLSVALSQ